MFPGKWLKQSGNSAISFCKMGALGRHSAVAEVFGIRLSGFVAWFLWRTVYLMKLPGWGRRLKVAVAWTLDLMASPAHRAGPSSGKPCAGTLRNDS